MTPELIRALTWACSTISKCLDRGRYREALLLATLIEAATKPAEVRVVARPEERPRPKLVVGGGR